MSAALYGGLLALQRNERAVVKAIEDIGHVGLWWWLLSGLRRNRRAADHDQAKQNRDGLLKCAHGRKYSTIQVYCSPSAFASPAHVVKGSFRSLSIWSINECPSLGRWADHSREAKS